MHTEQRSDLVEPEAAARPWVPWLWIVAASALAHLWCLGSQFYMDDMSAIRDNPVVRQGTFWRALPTAWTNLGYVIQYRLFGMSPVAFHAGNWLLHTAVACALFGIGRDLVRGRAPAGVAWFGALLFAVHPLASEIPNYARTQDLAWVTLFSLLAAWSLLRFLRYGGWPRLAWAGLGILGAALSKGPGLVHALVMTGVIGLAYMPPTHWGRLRRRGGWLAGALLLGAATLWLSGIGAFLRSATQMWQEPRFIGHAYTLARVFWEFAWRSVIPLALCSDHHIAETLVPPGAHFWNIPDTGAILAALAMLALTALSLVLAWRKPTRLFGVCLLLYLAAILLRVLYLIPEFMPEYRIYPGMPWFCLGAAIALAAAWRTLAGGVSPRIAALLVLLVGTCLSARRAWLWHDLDRLTADILRQYPAQARAAWELQDRDLAAGEWQKVIDRQRQVWPQILNQFMAENRRLAPRRELPSGHFALADVACAGHCAAALAHVAGPAAGLREINRLEGYMRRLNLDPVAHQLHWGYFYQDKLAVLEVAGNYQAAFDFMQRAGWDRFSDATLERVWNKLKPGS